MARNEKNLENTIDYWKKHQELDKFNYNFVSTYFISLITIIIAIFIPTILYFLGKLDFFSIISVFVLSASFLVIVLTILVNMLLEQNKHQRSFRIREAMLRVWYQEEGKGVDTDKLDSIFEDIKCRYNTKLSNKDIENIAKEFIFNKKSKKQVSPVTSLKKGKSILLIFLLIIGEFFLLIDAGFIGYSMEHGIRYFLEKVVFWILLILGVSFKFFGEKLKYSYRKD